VRRRGVRPTQRTMSRRRTGAVLVLLAAVGVVAGVVIISETPSKPRSADSSTGSGATAVQRRAT
jgi:ferric-dicitrate binding protein FerR (iron transport regulator)